jgi:hypothetical protein
LKKRGRGDFPDLYRPQFFTATAEPVDCHGRVYYVLRLAR